MNVQASPGLPEQPALREQPGPRALKALRALWDYKEPSAPRVPRELPVILAPPVPPGLPGPRVSLVRREQPDPLVPPGLLDLA